MTFDSPESPSHRSAPVAEDRTLRSTRRSLRIFSLLLSGVLLLVVLMVLAIAQRQNRDATDHDRQRLRQAWDARQETMLTDVRDYAFWSEA
ncbi:MAG TPA: bifunctional diguanylate cyclase/phosphodiesterase, partial [Pantoea septica]|nr:bifunctional diguanylate cyclase/phosphodiesterase [Pantoea septica]